MALQLGALREALVKAGDGEDLATKAAKEAAGYENRFANIERQLAEMRERFEGRFNTLTWMVGTIGAIALANLVKSFFH